MNKNGLAFLSSLLFLSAIILADEKPQEVEGMEFGVQAVITAVEGKGAELSAIMLEASKVVSELDGCDLYIVQQSLSDDSKVLITEVWRNKDAHQASLLSESVRELISKAKPIIANMEYNPARFIGGYGI